MPSVEALSKKPFTVEIIWIFISSHEIYYTIAKVFMLMAGSLKVALPEKTYILYPWIYKLVLDTTEPKAILGLSPGILMHALHVFCWLCGQQLSPYVIRTALVLRYVSLVFVMLGYMVSPVGEFSQKVFGVDFIVNFMLDFCPLLDI